MIYQSWGQHSFSTSVFWSSQLKLGGGTTCCFRILPPSLMSQEVWWDVRWNRSFDYRNSSQSVSAYKYLRNNSWIRESATLVLPPKTGRNSIDVISTIKNLHISACMFSRHQCPILEKDMTNANGQSAVVQCSLLRVVFSSKYDGRTIRHSVGEHVQASSVPSQVIQKRVYFPGWEK